DLQPDAPAPVGDSRDVDPHAEVRERVRAQAAEILARANRANAASGVEQAQDDFATDRAEAEEDLHRDLVQGDGDGDVLNVSTNRIETRNEQRRPREDKPEREMTLRERVEARAAEIYANQPKIDRNDDEGNRSWRR
ncbi:hypothetical protein, partial [Burkholderia multivorans]